MVRRSEMRLIGQLPPFTLSAKRKDSHRQEVSSLLIGGRWLEVVAFRRECNQPEELRWAR